MRKAKKVRVKLLRHALTLKKHLERRAKHLEFGSSTVSKCWCMTFAQERKGSESSFSGSRTTCSYHQPQTCTAVQFQRLQAGLRTRTCRVAHNKGSRVATPFVQRSTTTWISSSRTRKPRSITLRNLARLAVRHHLYKCCTCNRDLAASRCTQPRTQHNCSLHEPFARSSA